MGTESSEPADVSAVERGLLHHRFMEHVIPSRARSIDGVIAEIQRLVGEGRFTPLEAAGLDPSALARFWSGPLGRILRQDGGHLLRELPFTLRLDVGELQRLGFAPDPGLAPEEFLVVQGVIDLVWIGGDSAWILDFKTDRISDGALAAKAGAYRPQLSLYALAVERLLGHTVTAGWLHFLANGAEVDVLGSDLVA